jgi:hypothetical protein
MRLCFQRKFTNLGRILTLISLLLLLPLIFYPTSLSGASAEGIITIPEGIVPPELPDFTPGENTPAKDVLDGLIKDKLDAVEAVVIGKEMQGGGGAPAPEVEVKKYQVGKLAFP